MRPFGEFHKDFRMKTGKSMGAVARKAEIHHTVILRIENKKTASPRLDTLCKIANGHGMLCWKMIKLYEEEPT